MLKMIIVDDEKAIRESMRDSIDWASLGINVVGFCRNGLEAYDMILDESPDIVITDIKMPRLSGLELIERITQVGQGAEFIILSGYGEFSFTKEAMRYGVRHYMLKPCNEEELIDAVFKAAQDCYAKRARRDERAAHTELLRNLQESVFYNLIVECYAGASDFEERAQQYEQYIDFSQVAYELIDIRCQSEARLMQILREVHNHHALHAPGIQLHCVSAETTAWIFHERYDYDYSKLDALLSAQPDASLRRTHFVNLHALLPHIKDALTGFDHARILHKGKWTCLSRSQALEAQSLDQSVEPTTGKDFIDKTMRYVREHLADRDISLKMIAETQLFMNVDYLSRQFVKHVGCKFSAYLAQMRVEEAKRLMAHEPDMTVQEIASRVGCANNPQYFSVLFKKQTGLTPTDYLKQKKGTK